MLLVYACCFVFVRLSCNHCVYVCVCVPFVIYRAMFYGLCVCDLCLCVCVKCVLFVIDCDVVCLLCVLVTFVRVLQYVCECCL